MATHGKTRDRVIAALEARKPFTTSGSLSAEEGATYSTGRMSDTDAREYDADRDSITYTVMSYGTPIAWVLTDGSVKIPDATYSRTTGQQITLVRAHLR